VEVEYTSTIFFLFSLLLFVFLVYFDFKIKETVNRRPLMTMLIVGLKGSFP
jgi:hypothetical protein